MAIGLIISDIDGCISPEESRPWDTRLFNRFVDRVRTPSSSDTGLAPLTLCTGRPQPYVEALLKILGIRYPAICEGGAVLYSLQDNRSVFTPEVTLHMVHALHELREFILAEVLPEVPGLVYQFGKEAQLSLFSEDPSVFPSVQARIESRLRERGGPDVLITPSHYYLNIDLKGVTKGAAIRHLLNDAHLSTQEAAGIGDTLGDMSIREEVAFFACPANAVPEIQAVADYVSPYPDIAGVLDILERPELSRS